MTKGKVRKTSLRQRLRQDAEARLARIVGLMNTAAIRVTEEAETDINPFDVMRLLVSGQSKTVKAKLITDLANEAEIKLEKIYNDQIELLGVSND